MRATVLGVRSLLSSSSSTTPGPATHPQLLPHASHLEPGHPAGPRRGNRPPALPNFRPHLLPRIGADLLYTAAHGGDGHPPGTDEPTTQRDPVIVHAKLEALSAEPRSVSPKACSCPPPHVWLLFNGTDRIPISSVTLGGRDSVTLAAELLILCLGNPRDLLWSVSPPEHQRAPQSAPAGSACALAPRESEPHSTSVQASTSVGPCCQGRWGWRRHNTQGFRSHQLSAQMDSAGFKSQLCPLSSSVA